MTFPGAYATFGDGHLTRATMDETQGVIATVAAEAFFGAAGAVAYTLACAAGSYALAGQPVGLRADRRVTASAGAYTLAGQAATLTYSGGAVDPPWPIARRFLAVAARHPAMRRR